MSTIAAKYYVYDYDLVLDTTWHDRAEAEERAQEVADGNECTMGVYLNVPGPQEMPELRVITVWDYDPDAGKTKEIWRTEVYDAEVVG